MKSCLYVHKWHCQERSRITGTTGDVTQGDLRDGAGDNFTNGGGDGIFLPDIGRESAAAVAGKMSDTTINEENPTRGGDLR
jgi:hypothetical protein